MRYIRLNFLPFTNQEFEVSIFRKEANENQNKEDLPLYTIRNDEGDNIKYEISFEETENNGFEKYTVPIHVYHNIVSKWLFQNLKKACESINGYLVRKPEKHTYKRIHFILEEHPKGNKCVWIEPHFMKSQKLWGILVGFQFVVNDNLIQNKKFTLDKDILIASGALNLKGHSNPDFYLFKHNNIKVFIQKILPILNEKSALKITPELLEVQSFQLKPKEYFFKNSHTSNSSFYGLTKSGPLETIPSKQIYDFIYKKDDRIFAVALLKGLRGETSPNTFSGMEKLFKVDFSNNVIKGSPINTFSEEEIDNKIAEIKQNDGNVLPIIITNAKKDIDDEKVYYFLKNKFTNAGIACQVVTKDLIRNENSLKYSLANIGLQIFAKSGGKPWKMKSGGNDYLIIGIGQSYNIEKNEAGNIIEKNITYSVLTDSSGIFKDIQILSEGLETDDTYWEKLINNIAAVINNAQCKHVVIHTPFRMSKSKVLDKVANIIDNDIEFTTIVINDKNNYFGFDYLNNGLVPYEGSFIKVSYYEYLTWFEGIQSSNPKITKRFSNPLLIKFWHSNNPDLLDDYTYRETLLQDCINLSGANWRGFKAKQLPVSIYYCQRIAEFIGKFREFHLEHVEINNLKPWFL